MNTFTFSSGALNDLQGIFRLSVNASMVLLITRGVNFQRRFLQALPQLTSPLSPPAFNPADIILGSNEAIAGLDSPALRFVQSFFTSEH